MDRGTVCTYLAKQICIAHCTEHQCLRAYLVGKGTNGRKRGESMYYTEIGHPNLISPDRINISHLARLFASVQLILSGY